MNKYQLFTEEQSQDDEKQSVIPIFVSTGGENMRHQRLRINNQILLNSENLDRFNEFSTRNSVDSLNVRKMLLNVAKPRAGTSYKKSRQGIPETGTGPTAQQSPPKDQFNYKDFFTSGFQTLTEENPLEGNYVANSANYKPQNNSKMPFFHNYYKNKKKFGGGDSRDSNNKSPISFGSEFNMMLKYEKGEVKPMDLFSRKQFEEENSGKRPLTQGRRLKL